MASFQVFARFPHVGPHVLLRFFQEVGNEFIEQVIQVGVQQQDLRPEHPYELFMLVPTLVLHDTGVGGKEHGEIAQALLLDQDFLTPIAVV